LWRHYRLQLEPDAFYIIADVVRLYFWCSYGQGKEETMNDERGSDEEKKEDYQS